MKFKFPFAEHWYKNYEVACNEMAWNWWKNARKSGKQVPRA